MSKFENEKEWILRAKFLLGIVSLFSLVVSILGQLANLILQNAHFPRLISLLLLRR